MHRNKAGVLLLVLATAAVVWNGCERRGTEVARQVEAPAAAPVTTPGTGTSAGEIVAYVDGVPITNADVEKAAQGRLQKLQSQIYQVKRQALDDVVAELLIQKAAKDKGMSPEAYLAEEVDSHVEPPTDKQIEAFYEQQKAQIRAPLDEVRGKISDYLKRSGVNEKRSQLVARLREGGEGKVRLEPPRTQVTLDGAAFTLGDEGAPIVLVEFSDFQCPYSKRAQPSVQQVLDKYKGKVRYAFFDYPLPFHKEAQKAHEAVRCAAEQGKAVAYSERLFEDQKKLGVKDLKEHAEDLGLDEKKFDACLDSGAYASQVEQSVEKGKQAGVTGTPAFFVNGILISGAQPFDAFQSVVEEELAR